MVYIFDPLQVECLIPIDHKYPILILLNLGPQRSFVIIGTQSQTRASTEVPLTPLYKESLCDGLSILRWQDKQKNEPLDISFYLLFAYLFI
jgi:hypothetical protein